MCSQGGAGDMSFQPRVMQCSGQCPRSGGCRLTLGGDEPGQYGRLPLRICISQEGKDAGLSRGGPWAPNEDMGITGRGGDEMLWGRLTHRICPSSATDESLLLSAGESQASVVA